MGHGWVLTKVNDKAGVLAATAAAGASNNYVPPNDPRVIAFIPLVGGGETHEVTIDTSKLKHGEEYLYFCPFPGHSATMKGELFFG
jgi:azurin